MLIPKSDESFPFCPPFFSEGWNEQGFTLEFSFEKGRGRDRKREKRGSEERHRNIRGGGTKKIQDIRRGERKVKSKKRAENRVREVRSRAKMEALWKTQLVHVEETEEHSRTDTKGVSMTLQELQSDTC